MTMHKAGSAFAATSQSVSVLPRVGELNVASYTIGDLAREYGVTLRALRFYEDKGLLTPVRDGLTRIYSEGDRRDLELILKGKRLGFTLVEISEMLASQGGGHADSLLMSRETVREQIAHLEKQRVEIDEALAELRKSYEALAREAEK